MSLLTVRTAFVLCFLASTARAQAVERVELDGRDATVYNLAGTLRIEGGSGTRVVVEVTRGGAAGGRLVLDRDPIDGHSTLRVRYPEDRIVYSALRNDGRVTITTRDDGTFGDENGRTRGSERRRIEIRSAGDGLDAHADLRVVVPKGAVLHVHSGVGEATIDNVDGRLSVSVAASRVRATHVTGSLSLHTGSGGVEVSDITGDLTLDTGSGGASLDGVRGGTVRMDVGSGSIRGRSIDVRELTGDVGSGGIRLSAVKTGRLHLETGSGGSDIELLAPTNDISIEAGSGGVTLRMPAAVNAAVDLESGSGGIDTDFEVRVQHMERGALRGAIGTGGGRIHIESGSGTIRLLKLR